ncbi:MAG: hypothetical protein K2Q22_18115, partial [Cytophagales bacterium]|nr:hypothetical protein [Cytophagales bacterium]
DNQPLESAGMLRIDAYDVSENAVIIKPGEKMVLRLPNRMKLSKDGFEDFYGEMNESTKQINWKVSVDTSDVLWADSVPRSKIGEKGIQQLFKGMVKKENLKCNEITEVKLMVMKNGKVRNVEFADWELDKRTKQFVTDLLINKTHWLPAEHNGIKYNMYSTIYLYNKDAEAAQPVVQKIVQANPVANVAKMNVSMEINTSNYLGMSIDRLGWINCDRFYNFPANTITHFKVNSSSVSRGRLIFKWELSMLPMSSFQSNEMVFMNVPKELPVYVYLEKYVGNKRFISFSETIISSTPYSPPAFVEATDEVLKMIDVKLKK